MKTKYNSFYTLLLAFVLTLLIVGSSCNSEKPGKISSTDSLTEDQKRLSENALKGLNVYDDLEVRLVAAEPLFKNPTNIDVDDRGRVWVTEAYNYRPFNGNPINPAGDRIMILEDTNGDGQLDTAKVFYQGPEIDAPLGVCVLGNRVIISQSPYVWVFYDDNADDKADRKEILFQGIGGEQHDHGMHSFTFGPDGKLYFNFGNEGKTLKDKNGKTVLDQDGDEIGPGKYKQGMVFRCNPDGTEVECLGQNFRNNFEVAVDSYGTMWQSDNDDDGNKGTRINYVMDYGNYGFTDEMTGAGWQASRTNMEDSIPLRHWHLNDPGVVPNLLQTGAGSPTGMAVYEGSLLPAVFQNQLIHCEPGNNVVRSYVVKNNGAGYDASIENILEGNKDQWFRPADVSVAPDGSLIVADWYDAVVGGHDNKDQERGRLYRIAPKRAPYKIPVFDYSLPEGAIAALQNPNLAVRSRAWLSLHEMGNKSLPVLEKLWYSQSVNPRMRARALWLLSKTNGGEKYIAAAIKDKNADIRITAIRAARQLKINILPLLKQLVNDKNPQVRRECALALHHKKNPEAAQLWANLAAQHDGKDRWYLEALGIGADGQWESFFEAYLRMVPDPLRTPQGKDIVWRARTDKALPFLSALASDENVDWKSRQRYFRAFDFHTGTAKSKTLLAMIAQNTKNDITLNALLLHHLSPNDVKQSSITQNALQGVLKSEYGTERYLELVNQYEVKSEMPRLMELILSKSGDQLAAGAVKQYLAFGGEEALKNILTGKDSVKINSLLTAFGDVGYEQTLNMTQQVLLSNNYSKSLRKTAALSLGRTYGGEHRVMDLIKGKKLPKQFITPLMSGMEHGPRRSMYLKVEALLTDSSSSNKAPFDREAVLALKGDAIKGKAIFANNCALCHQVLNVGVDFGPKLSEIGSKLPPVGLLEAITNPSGGISFGFESWEINMKNGSVTMGIIASRTDNDLIIKYPGGKKETILIRDIKTMKKMPESIMPALQETMNAQQLSDLLSYLSSLKKK
ncbi:MAG: PVC-type heme-binding CxxCH protein [Sphingobacteriaceae bacterium]